MLQLAFSHILVYSIGVYWRHQMTRMTISVDQDILNEAKDLLHAHTKRETIELALIEVIKQKKREKTIKNCGKIDIDLTQKELEEYRNKS
jgi:Arc/MetJ family transcription regulator